MRGDEEARLESDELVRRLRAAASGDADLGFSDLRGASLAKADLSKLDLSGWDLSGADLRGADLSGTNLSGANLSTARLEEATLYDANLDRCELIGANLRGANLVQAHAVRAGLGATDLRGARLSSAECGGATLTQAKLSGADLQGTNLRGARLVDADLCNVDAGHADLREADLSGCRVERASLRGADLRKASLANIGGYEQADWIGVDVRDADFRDAYLLRRHVADENYLHEFRSRSRTNRVVYWLWWATSDCGRSFMRWGFWVAALTCLFAVVYENVPVDWGPYRTPISSLYFSVVTMTTLGYGDVHPASFSAQVVSTIQVIVSYLALGGLIGIFANKMARRAD